MEAEDTQGTLTLWFHEDQGKDGNPSYKVYGVSNCHVLHKNTIINYEHKGGAPKDFVRVCRVCQFQWGLNEIKKHISDHGICADFYTREINGLEVMENQSKEVVSKINMNRHYLDGENEAIHQLKALYDEVLKYWFNIKLRCDIGYVQHAKTIKVDIGGSTRYTSDWGMFLAAEAKVKDQFEGNVVDLGAFQSFLSLPCLTKTTLFRVKIFS